MSQVWALALPDSEKIVLLALADCANDEGLCWPSMRTLASKCSKSDRTVQAAIKSLVDTGHMSRSEVPGKGCRYIIHPTPEATSPPKWLRGETASPPKPATPTPEAASDKPSRTITPPKASPSSVARKGSRLPDDWKPVRFADDTVARSIIDSRGVDWARRVIEQFRNHWRTATGTNARKLDWQAAWANWVIEQDNRDGRRTRSDGMGRAGQSGSGHGRSIDAGIGFVEDGGYH